MTVALAIIGFSLAGIGVLELYKRFCASEEDD
jgi:hypothetical protein